MLTSQTAIENDSPGTLREHLCNGCKVWRLLGRRERQSRRTQREAGVWEGGIGDGESLEVVEHLFAIDVVVYPGICASQ